MWLFDSDPSGIVLGEARRDVDLADTDAFLIVFDTYLDRQNAFVFGTTPAGIEYDGQVTKQGEGGFTGNRQQARSGGGLNLNWDGSWDVAKSVDERGWYAEFRIPFSTLRYGRGGPQLWEMNLARYVRRRNEQSYWSPVPRPYDLYRVSLAGTVQGIQAPSRRTVTVTPYALSTDQFSGNFRFGWLSTAGTGLFVVFNETQSTDEPTGPLDRALIVKLTRQFVLAR